MSTVLTNNFTELATGDSVGAKYVVHGSAKVWSNFNGTGTIALRDSLNVSSITDLDTGNYSATFASATADGNYSIHGMSGGTNSITATWPQAGTTPSTTVIASVYTNTAGTLTDLSYAGFSIYGDLA